MTQARNIDDILTQPIEQQKDIEVKHIPQSVQSEVPPAPEVPENPIEQKQVESPVQEKPEVQQTTPQEIKDSPIDEYGNPVAKPKTYTEEEVQRLIRERISRERHAAQQQSPPHQTAQPSQQQVPEENWDVQLEQFIENTLEKRQKRQTEEQWQQEENRRQQEFESKFNHGMQQYHDFHQVVSGKPITNGMMLATRNLENPAAFIYGASKLYAGDLDRISKIQDPYVQSMEIGRLHEKMVKSKASTSSVKPIEPVTSDMITPRTKQLSIEERIHEHAESKRRR